MDATINFYSTASETDNFIRDTQLVLRIPLIICESCVEWNVFRPSDDLNKYLKQMGKLKEAIKFFSSHPSYAAQLEAIVRLFRMYCWYDSICE